MTRRRSAGGGGRIRTDGGLPTEDVPDGGFDEWLDAIADGAPYYLACPAGHGSLPPRRVCPTCGDGDLAETPLPTPGEVLVHSTVEVATPGFADDAPYVTAIADFDGVQVTGVVRGVEPDAVERGLAVVPRVEERATTGERLLVFRPAA
jgi:uncharacterized OB-fold protein